MWPVDGLHAGKDALLLAACRCLACVVLDAVAPDRNTWPIGILESNMAGQVVGHAAEAASHGVDLVPIVALLGAAVIGVPLFKRLGLGSVLGYLAAGILLDLRALP